jgi:hypothetical protein
MGERDEESTYQQSNSLILRLIGGVVDMLWEIKAWERLNTEKKLYICNPLANINFNKKQYTNVTRPDLQ